MNRAVSTARKRARAAARKAAAEAAAEVAAQRRRRWVQRLRGVLASLIVLALALILGWWSQRPLPGAGRMIEIRAGEALGPALRRLESDGVLDTPQRWLILGYARLRGWSGSVRAGEYAVPEQASAPALLDLLRSGKVVLHETRFIEGWRFTQAWQTLAASPDVEHTLPDDADGAVLMRALGVAGTDPEGHFFPDTYRFAKHTPDVVILRQAYQAMARRLAEAWTARAADLPYASAEEALIMASLVEKETAVDSERAQIAGVFVRRLRLGMRLQTDPSVIYGLGAAFDGNLRLRDLRTDTPYNSYTRNGLPPTPICLPGAASIQAALHPADGNALYFVARGDGTHQFSATLEAHNAAVRRYQLGGGGR